jgi:hypothetical protein
MISETPTPLNQERPLKFDSSAFHEWSAILPIGFFCHRAKYHSVSLLILSTASRSEPDWR